MKTNTIHQPLRIKTLVIAATLSALSAVSGADTIYVANPGDNTIVRFTQGGVGLLFANTGLSNPQAMTFDSAGNLFVANFGNNTIRKFTPAGVGSVFASTGLNHPVGLAFDSAGNLYATASPGIVVKFTPGGVGSVFASGLSSPTFLTFDSTGNLYAGSLGNSRIDKFTPGGVASVFSSTGVNYPYGMGFDSDGNLFVANVYGNTVEKYTPGGVGTVFANTSLHGPTGLAVKRGEVVQDCAEQLAAVQAQLAAATNANAALQAQLTNCNHDLAAANQTIQNLQNEILDLLLPLQLLTQDFRTTFKDPQFQIRGNTAVEQMQNLVAEILNLPRGQKQALYIDLGGHRGNGRRLGDVRTLGSEQ